MDHKKNDMKIFIIILPLAAHLLFSCKKETKLNVAAQKPSIEVKPFVASINAIKNGEPFINYLGLKLEGC